MTDFQVSTSSTAARLARFEQDNARLQEVRLLTLHLLGAGDSLPRPVVTAELLAGVLEYAERIYYVGARYGGAGKA